MFFKQRVNDDASLSYFFGCGSQGKGIAVDVVAGDEAWYIDEARKLNVAITMVFDTHIHADHLSGGLKLAELANASYLLHESNQGKTGYPFTPVHHNQVLLAGNTRDRYCIPQATQTTASPCWYRISDVVMRRGLSSPAIHCLSAQSGVPTWLDVKPRWRHVSGKVYMSNC